MLGINANCILCKRKLNISWYQICSFCYEQMPQLKYCSKCGKQNQHNVIQCSECIQHEPSWDKLVFAFEYKPPLTTLVHRFKFRQQFWLDKGLARIMLLAIRQAQREHQLCLPEVIIPIPLTRYKLLQRGFNQSLLLAKYLGLWLNIPVDTNVLNKVKDTLAQSSLFGIQRYQNVKDSFRSATIMQYKHVALVDDVMTTGATLRSACLALRTSNIEIIQVWLLGKT